MKICAITIFKKSGNVLVTRFNPETGIYNLGKEYKVKNPEKFATMILSTGAKFAENKKVYFFVR